MRQLADIREEFLAISDRACAVAGRVGEDHLATRARPNKWSVAECLSHLTITANAYLPLWLNAIASARAAGLEGHEPFRLDLWGRAFCWFLEPPPKLRFSAPSGFQPARIVAPRQSLPTFLESQARLLDVIAQGEGLPLDRIKIRSPFDRRIRYSLWSSFCANASHHRRHLWQAEQSATALSAQTLFVPPRRR